MIEGKSDERTTRERGGGRKREGKIEGGGKETKSVSERERQREKRMNRRIRSRTSHGVPQREMWLLSTSRGSRSLVYSV